MNQQDVVKRFMASLANHGYASSNTVGKDMLDGAIRASSRYLSATDAIDAMKADQVAAEKAAVEEVLGTEYAGKTLAEVPSNILSAAAKDYDTGNIGNGYFNEYNTDGRTTVERFIKERKSIIFLETYCGIVLEDRCFIDDNDNVTHYTGFTTGNTDTGAITGSDAGGSVEKTAASVVPETFANTYKATSNAAAQTIVTNERNWVIQATAGDDNITANGADSINAGNGSDTITVNASGATIDSGAGNDTVTVSENVDDITLSDLTSSDTLTIGGTFEFGSAQIVDGLLVVTDKTGTRKIRFGNYQTALDAKLNSTTVGQWLTNSGVDLDNLASSNYSDGKVNGSSGNVADDGRIALDDYTPTPAEEPAAPKLMFRRLRDASLTVNGINVDASQAGNVTDENSNVIGTVSNEFPNAETFTRNGLTIHLLGESSNSYTDNITAKTFAQLDDNQKTIVAALFKWWAAEALKLNEDSYGIGFNSPTATVKDIGLYFYTDENSGTLAAVNNVSRPADGEVTTLYLNVNMAYYAKIQADDVNGTSSVENQGYLDRTLAHEFTHAIMAANINYFSKLPQFVKEGTAELTHGIDDERSNRIFNLGYDANKLASALDVNNTDTGNADCYAGGYMFMRYLAKQAATQTATAPAFGEITATVNVSVDGIYYIYGTSTDETAQVASTLPDGAIKLGELANGVYTVNDTGVHQNISGVNKVSGLTVNDTFTGTDNADTVNTAQGSNIITGDGDDSINLHGQYATINAGAGADTVNVLDGSHHSIDLGDGNDSILATISGSKNFFDLGAGDDSINFGSSNSTVFAGDGNDSIRIWYSNQTDSFIDAGDGDDDIVVGGTGNTIKGGAGNDLIDQYAHTSTNTSTHGNVFVFDTEGFGNDSIKDFKADDKIILGAGFTYSSSDPTTINYSGGGTGQQVTVTVTKGTATVGTINVQTASGVTFDAATNIVTSHIEIDGLTYNKAGYYEISDAQDLVDLANYVNAGNGCRDMTFKVTGNIDMSTVENFTPIGKSDKPFAGTFDGDGNTISNLSIDANERCVALFSNLDAGGTIKNVVLSNATVQGTYIYGGYTSALVGGLVSYNNGTVTNCKVDAQLSGKGFNNYGALVCTNLGIVTGNTFHSNIDNAVCFDESSGTASNNTRVYAVNAPDGFEISNVTCTDESNVVTIGDKTFYKQGAQVTATVTAANDRLDIDGEPSFTATIGTADATLDVVGFYVQLTAGGESYYNTYSNVSVLGSAGNDIISNEGDNVTIDGGEGNDTIGNFGASVLIDVSKGDDSIKSLFVTEFDVRGFGVGDTIDLIGDVKNLNVDGDKLIATFGTQHVTIGGISAVSTSDTLWALDGNVAKYGYGKTAGAAISDGKIIFTDATVTNAKVQLGGISKLDGLSVFEVTDSDYKEVKINASAVAAGGASVVSNAGNYAFYLDGDWNGKTFTGTENADNIILNGTATNVSVNAGAGNDTIENYGGSNNTIDGGAGNDNIRNDGNNNTIDGGAGNDNIRNDGNNNTIDGGADDDTIFLAASGNTVNTAQGNDTIQIDTGNDVNDLTVEGFNVGDVIQFIGYEYNPDFDPSNFDPDNPDPDNPQEIEVAVAIDSLTEVDGKLVATAGGKTVTINGLDLSQEVGGWQLDNNVATYFTGTTSGAYFNGSNIYFRESSTVEQFKLGGISNVDGLSIGDNNIVNIDASAVAAGGASIVSNEGNYNFTLLNNWNGKTFTGNDVTNVINIDGSAKNVSVDAGDGNDIISNNASNVSIDGGAGNDLIINSGWSNTINTAQGNDTIKIDTTSEVTDFTVEGFNVGDVIQFIDSNYDNVAVTDLKVVDGKLVATAGDKTVTINGLDLSQENGWKLDGDTATYFTGTTSGAFIDGKQISFRAGTELVDKLVLGGISNAPTVDGNKVQLTAYNFAGDTVSVTSNVGGYDFELSGELTGKTFNGSDGVDKISNAGTNVAINGGAGNDDISNSGNGVTIDAGAGNDTIENSSTAATIDGGAGSNTISLTGNTGTSNVITDIVVKTDAGANTIKVGADMKIFSVNGFGRDDAIELNQLLNAANFSIVEGNLVAGDVTVSGMGTFNEGGGFSATDDGSIVYSAGTDSVTVAKTTFADNQTVSTLVYRKDGSELADESTTYKFTLKGLAQGTTDTYIFEYNSETADSDTINHGFTITKSGDSETKHYAFATNASNAVKLVELTYDSTTSSYTLDTNTYTAISAADDYPLSLEPKENGAIVVTLKNDVLDSTGQTSVTIAKSDDDTSDAKGYFLALDDEVTKAGVTYGQTWKADEKSTNTATATITATTSGWMMNGSDTISYHTGAAVTSSTKKTITITGIASDKVENGTITGIEFFGTTAYITDSDVVASGSTLTIKNATFAVAPEKQSFTEAAAWAETGGAENGYSYNAAYQTAGLAVDSKATTITKYDTDETPAVLFTLKGYTLPDSDGETETNPPPPLSAITSLPRQTAWARFTPSRSKTKTR